MKIAALIPARYDSTRFPGKLMKEIGNKTIIRRVYENMKATELFDHVAVVCDSEIIYNEIISNGGTAYMSSIPHENGTSRIAEIAKNLDYDIFFNIQGDEPFVHKEIMTKLLDLFVNDHQKTTDIVSPMMLIREEEMINNPNVVKVITNIFVFFMYFSRSPIPFRRNLNVEYKCYKHIGIYGFRKEALLKASSLPDTPLDASEMIECIKYLEHGMKIKMAETPSQGISIDTPEDLEKALELYESGVY
mgnify:FL=1